MKYIKAYLPRSGNQSGYVLPWVIIVMLVAGIILVPFLSWMMTSLTGTHHHLDVMQEYYAADSGIEDAVYKMQTNYSAMTTLSEYVDDDDDIINVEEGGTADFPARGVIQIEAELVYYSSKDDGSNSFAVFDDPATPEVVDGRGYNDTKPASHDEGTPVTCGLPRTFNEAWQYTIEDVNAKQVDVTIEQRWVLEGLEEPKSGTMPHADLVVVGRVVDMTEEYTIYGIEIYAYNPGAFKINRIGAWLPSGFEYLPGSTTLGTTLDEVGGLTSDDKNIDVESTTLFSSEGVIAIGYDDEFPDTGELIPYSGKTGTRFKNCKRGDDATGHPNHASVSNEPAQVPYNGGTALMWDMHPAVDYEDLPSAPPEGGFTSGDEYPIRKAMYFKFTPPEYPMGIFSWVRTNRNDIYLSWDITSGSYRITSTATDPFTGTHTTIYSYVNRDKQYGILPLVGDAKVIGNSLIRDEDGDGIRESLESETSATISGIPEEATVEAAYLYWSGWKSSPPAYIPGDTDKIETLAQMVDEARLEVEGTKYNIEADRVQLLPSGNGWSFSCFKDLTSLLRPDSSANLTLYPIGEVGSVIITNTDPDKEAQVEITASSGNPDSMWVDATTKIEPGSKTTPPVKIPEGASVVLQAGATAGTYQATIELKGNGEVTVDGTTLERPGGTTETTETLETTYTDYPQMKITNLTTTSPEVTVSSAADNPPDYPLIVDGDPSDKIEPGEPWDWPFGPVTSHTIEGTTYEPYNVNISVTKGKVEIICNDGMSLILGAPGSQIADGEYVLSNVEAYTTNLAPDGDDEDYWSEDLGKPWSYAGWSLIVIYSDPSLTPENGARHFFLYDNFLYAPSGASRTFLYDGFQAPADADGSWLYAFVGEGDANETGDYIKFNGQNLGNNVFNGASTAVVAQDIDIDVFDVSGGMTEGETSATVEIGAGDDEFNLIYLLLALRTEKLAQHGQYPTGITIYNFEGE